MQEQMMSEFYQQSRLAREAGMVDSQRSIVNQLKKDVRYIKNRKKSKFMLKATKLIAQLVQEENLLARYVQSQKQHRVLEAQQQASIKYWAIDPYTRQNVGPFDTYVKALEQSALLKYGYLPYQ